MGHYETKDNWKEIMGVCISKTQIDTELCRIISQLRFPIIVLLVFDHFNITNYESLRGLHNDYPILLNSFASFIITLISEIMGMCVVPACFLISGYLFFRTFDGSISSYSHKLKRRIDSLLIPFLIWNSIGLCFYLTYSLCQNNVEYHVSIFSVLAQYWNVSLFPLIQFAGQQNIVEGPIYSHLWYLQYLLFLVILSPLLWLLLKRIPTKVLIITCFLWLVHPSDLHYSLLMSHLGFGGVLFFLLGGYMSLGGAKIVEKALDVPTFAYVILFVFNVISYIYLDNTIWITYYQRVSLVIVIFFLFSVAKWMIQHGFWMNEFISKSSFMLYAMHLMFIPVWRIVLIEILRPESSNLQLLLWLFVCICNIVICVIFDIITRRLVPTINRTLTGGR